jgi:hypothetical protein
VVRRDGPCGLGDVARPVLAKKIRELHGEAAGGGVGGD